MKKIEMQEDGLWADETDKTVYVAVGLDGRLPRAARTGRTGATFR